MKKIALEIIYDKDYIMGYEPLDPKTLSKKWVNNTWMWIQHENTEYAIYLFESQVLTNF